MAFFAMAMFVIMLVIFAYALLGYAGISAEIGWLFAVLGLVFLVAAARLEREDSARGRIAAGTGEEFLNFGPYIHMKTIPVAMNDGGGSAEASRE